LGLLADDEDKAMLTTDKVCAVCCLFVYCLLSNVRCPLSTVCCLLSAACCLLADYEDKAMLTTDQVLYPFTHLDVLVFALSFAVPPSQTISNPITPYYHR
jgi:hypothetical protein